LSLPSIEGRFLHCPAGTLVTIGFETFRLYTCCNWSSCVRLRWDGPVEWMWGGEESAYKFRLLRVLVVAGMAWSVRGSSPGGGMILFGLTQTAPEAHPASCAMGTVFSGVQRPWRGAEHPPPSIVGVEYARSYTSTSPLCPLSCKGTAYPFFFCKVVEFLPAKTLSLGSWSAACLFCNCEIVNHCIWVTGGMIIDT